MINEKNYQKLNTKFNNLWGLKKVTRTKNKFFILLGSKNKIKIYYIANIKFKYLLGITNIF